MYRIKKKAAEIPIDNYLLWAEKVRAKDMPSDDGHVEGSSSCPFIGELSAKGVIYY